jgi:hypothetical protein
VYQYSNSSWNQIGLDIDGEAEEDESGYSVSLSSNGTIVAIGAPFNDGTGSDSGHVRVYELSTYLESQSEPEPDWSLLEQFDGGNNDLLGSSVSLAYNNNEIIVAIGADQNMYMNGYVQVHKYDGSSWEQLGGDIDGEAAGDTLGYSVSLSSDGTIVAIGAPTNDENGSNSGHVRVYQLNGSSWEQLGGDIDGEDNMDNSGHSVSLSSDGTIVAIGAPYNYGINGFFSGHVRVYQYDVNKTTSTTDQSSIDFGPVRWRRLGLDIDGEGNRDRSGYSVSLSSDGTIVAIGAILNDENGSSSGYVRVYQWDGSSWSQLGEDIYGEVANVYSTLSVSLSSDGYTVAIGATPGESDEYVSGHVRVYQYSDSSWTQLGGDIDGNDGDKSGHSVSLSSDGYTVAIGVPYGDSGHVRVCQYDNVNYIWTQLGSDIDGEAYIGHGSSVSLSPDGTIVAIGAPRNSEGYEYVSGYVRVYKYGI